MVLLDEVKRRLSELQPEVADLADALAIGITGLNFIREQELRERMR